MYNDIYNFKLAQMVNSRENILWQSKPNKICFILECIFNPFAAFALLWFLFDAFFIFAFIGSSEVTIDGTPTTVEESLKFTIPFFALHLMPVWIYLGGVFLSFNKYKNTEYIITDKAVYISNGILGFNYERKEIKTLSDISIRQGFFDRHLMVGDVILEKHEVRCGKSSQMIEFAINDIPDFQNVYSMIIDLQADIQRRNQA